MRPVINGQIKYVAWQGASISHVMSRHTIYGCGSSVCSLTYSSKLIGASISILRKLVIKLPSRLWLKLLLLLTRIEEVDLSSQVDVELLVFW